MSDKDYFTSFVWKTFAEIRTEVDPIIDDEHLFVLLKNNSRGWLPWNHFPEIAVLAYLECQKDVILSSLRVKDIVDTLDEDRMYLTDKAKEFIPDFVAPHIDNSLFLSTFSRVFGFQQVGKIST